MVATFIRISILHIYVIVVLISIEFIATTSVSINYKHQEHIEKEIHQQCDVTHLISKRREHQDKILSSNDTIRNAKYVVARPAKAGLADVILGYVAGFVWSLILNRPYVIQHIADLGDCEQRSIEYAYKPNKITWSYQLQYDTSMFDCMNVSIDNCESYLNVDNIVYSNDVTAAIRLVSLLIKLMLIQYIIHSIQWTCLHTIAIKTSSSIW